MLKNTMNKIWNSKAMDMFGEVGYGVLSTMKEVLVDTFGNEKEGYDIVNNPVPYVKEKSTETYDYWMTLTYQEQKEYFERNEYLKIYTNDFYENDRELTAKHVQRIADKLNKEFTNKYDRY